MADFIRHRFYLSESTKKRLHLLKPDFGFDGFGATVYYRSYSRKMADGTQEHWPDTVIRVIEGIMSIRKNHMILNHLNWDDEEWQSHAKMMAMSMFRMEWLPPGRGLWACGSEFMYKKGAAALYNCAYATTKDLVKGCTWSMDALMCGCGVGSDVIWKGRVWSPKKVDPTIHVVADSREGWVESVRLLMESYIPSDGKRKNPVAFDYSQIRAEGEPLKTFGGTACGYKPLEKLHIRLRIYFRTYELWNLYRWIQVGSRFITAFDLEDGNDMVSDQGSKNLNESLVSIVKPVKKALISHHLWTPKVESLYEQAMKAISDPDVSNVSNLLGALDVLLDLDDTLKFVDHRGIFCTDNLTPGILNLYKTFDEELKEHSKNASDPTDAFIYMVEQLWEEEKEYWAGIGMTKMKLFDQIRTQGKKKTYGRVRLIADIINAIGACVVAGNIRRSSEILIGDPDDSEFLNLKNVELNPERGPISWMSNNTVRLQTTDDFSHIPMIAERIRTNGEPGFFNQINTRRYGRVGRRFDSKDPWTREHEEDEAEGLNPCLTGETLIDTSEGQVPITDLVGKQFVAIIRNGKYPSTEAGFWSNGVKPVFKIVLESGRSARATSNHRFHGIADESYGDDWLEVQALIPGNELVLRDGELDPIVSISPDGEEEVYDCTIPGAHAFVANGIGSHNCGEATLEPFEVCNLSETVLPRCANSDRTDILWPKFKKAVEYATFYSSTVTLLPTHWPETNAVVARNRRIGVSTTGVSDAYGMVGFTRLTRLCRDGYKAVREENSRLASLAGVCASIRVTMVKPSGKVSKVAGVSSGLHYHPFRFAIRRMRVTKGTPIVPVLQAAGYPYEDDVYTDNTLCFEFPIDFKTARSAQEVSMWEQFSLLAMMSREWADNAVSVTINFDPKTEADQIEHALAQYAPVIKSCSMLPHTDKGAYQQMPEEGITEEEFQRRRALIQPVDWRAYSGSDGICPKFCDGDTCEL